MVRAMHYSDPVPSGHISLDVALQIYRRAKHGENCDSPRGPFDFKDWCTIQDTAIERDVTALMKPVVEGQLEALVEVLVPGPHSRELRKIPADRIQVEWPTRLVRSDEMGHLPNGALVNSLAKFAFPTLYIDRVQFIAWLKRWLRDWITTEMQHGRINPGQAIEHAARYRLQSLEVKPE
jgi:hypothetical protein